MYNIIWRFLKQNQVIVFRDTVNLIVYYIKYCINQIKHRFRATINISLYTYIIRYNNSLKLYWSKKEDKYTIVLTSMMATKKTLGKKKSVLEYVTK